MPNVHGNLYEKLSEERKALVVSGENPEWFTTAAWQLFKDKISYNGANVLPTFKRISTTLSAHMPDSTHWEPIFYQLLADSFLSPSTPVISNTGTNKGYPVSCSGQDIGDSIDSFYKNLHETAQLTKFGFGVSGNLSGIRPRGTPYGVDGKADGVVPVIKTYVQAMRAVSQGSSRRGAWAGYLNVDHGDFFEVADYLLNNPDDLNMGWIFTRAFIARLEAGDEDAVARYQRVMYIRAVFGKGYIWKNDHANEQSPASYAAHNVMIKASNLCSEIALYSNDLETFTCVLSSLNLSNWDKFDKDTIFNSIVFLHCVALEFISKADGEAGMEKAVLFTKKNMALGLGTLGFHTYLQQNMIPMESFEANTINNQIYKKIKEESVRASEWLATVFGEPEMCKGTGMANTHRCVSGDTRLMTDKGISKIEDILGTPTNIWNGFKWSEVTPFQTGTDDVLYRVHTSDGRHLDCTIDHKWAIASPERTNLGLGGNMCNEVETNRLRVGDCIIKKLGAVINSPDRPSLTHPYTSGVFCGDGSINNSKADKYPRNELRLYDQKALLKDKIAWKSTTLWDAKIDGKVRGVRGYVVDDILPKYEVPINYSLDSRLKWLAGLIDSDGSCAKGKSITITMRDQTFARDVAELLTTLGCHGQVSERTRTSGYASAHPTYFSVGITAMEITTLMSLGMATNRIKMVGGVKSTLDSLSSKQYVKILRIEELDGVHASYCLTEPSDGLCVFNGIVTKQCAIAPNMSSAIMAGGVSQGIEPVIANVYTQATAGGEMERINPVLLGIMKERGHYNQRTINRIANDAGSVQNENWLSDHEKLVFKTAYEIDQTVLVRLASNRQRWVCQGQSLNLFFASDEDEGYISAVHRLALLDERIKGLYYMRSAAGVQSSKGECIACEG